MDMILFRQSIWVLYKGFTALGIMGIIAKITTLPLSISLILAGGVTILCFWLMARYERDRVFTVEVSRGDIFNGVLLMAHFLMLLVMVPPPPLLKSPRPLADWLFFTAFSLGTWEAWVSEAEKKTVPAEGEIPS